MSDVVYELLCQQEAINANLVERELRHVEEVWSQLDYNLRKLDEYRDRKEQLTKYIDENYGRSQTND